MEIYNLYIVIVLYKKKIIESLAYETLVKETRKFGKMSINIIIWNNSPDVLIKKENFIYYEGKNTTLPNIYNLLGNKYLNSCRDFLMISDDDTDYSNYNFEKLFDIFKIYKNQSGIFIPQLYANGKLVSPGKRFLFKGKYIDSINDGLIESKNVLGMNSGLIISYLCLNKMTILFNKKLNFYGTDTDFFIRYENYFDYIFVLPFKIKHDLSENNYDINRAIFRFKDDSFAINHTFSKRSFIIRFLLKLYILYKAIKLSLKYRSLEFIKVIV